MEFEFDKEMDAILRRARVGEAAVSFDSHIDADEVAAFAENALKGAARARCVAHFAECARCRNILSNVITLNQEAAGETASSVVAATVEEQQTPWYRRFFAFPQLAYAMGALVMLFSGFFAYLIFQNVPGSQNTEVSRAVDAPTQTEKSASAANSNASATTTNAATTNTTTTSNAPANTASAVSNSNALSTGNSASVAAPTERKSVLSEDENRPAQPQPQTSATPAPVTDGSSNAPENEVLSKSAPTATVDKPAVAGATREEKDRDKKEKESALSGASTDDSLKADAERSRIQRSQPASPKKKSNEAGAARTVGGKTFNNVGGIWFDAAYGKQKTKDVRRGTSDYQKLDAGLRSIVEQLGGTVVILWNDKAYRIQ